MQALASLTWSPTSNELGPNTVTFQVTDGHGGTATQAYQVYVQQQHGNHAPVITSQPGTSIVIAAPPANRDRITLDFEGLPATPIFAEGTFVPPEARLSDQFLTTDGVTLRSASGVPYVAVVNLGVGHAQSGTNGIGGMGSATNVDYATPVIAEFFLPKAPATPALTDFVSIKIDTEGTGETVFMDAFDIHGALLGTTSAIDAGGPTLTLSIPDIHSIAIRGTTTTAFDDLSFAEVYAIPTPSYEYDVKAVDPDKDSLVYSLTTAPNGMTIASGTGIVNWIPSPDDVGAHPVTVRVEDGRGGFDTQNYSLQVNQAQRGFIEGTVFNDQNANGVRDQIAPPLAPVVHLLTVPGMASPYLAGMPDGSTADAGDSAPAQSPLKVTGLSLVAGSSLMFTVPAGATTIQPGSNSVGPDGDFYDSHHAGDLNGLSNITAPVGSLLGVFLGNDRPDSSAAPPALDFFFPNVPGGANYTSLSPLLKQVFFIGDGRTSTGQIQQVVVPAGATRFFLATMDSTAWNNNSGSFAVDVRPFDPSAAPGLVKLTPISTPFDGFASVDFDGPLNEIVVNGNLSSGGSHAFAAIQTDGTQLAFSGVSPFPEQVYFAIARSGNPGGFKAGDLYSGNGQPGQIVRITDGGTNVTNPWITLPGEIGALRGGLTFDQTGVFGGNLIVETTVGNIWEVDVDGHATKLGGTGTFLEGLTTIPNDIARYGPLAGKVLATDKNASQIFTIDPSGKVAAFDIGVPDLAGASLVLPNENFFGVDAGNHKLLGASAASFTSLVGDILLRQELSGLFRLFWDGKALQVQPLNLAQGSAIASQWKGANFTGTAGVNQVAPWIFMEPALPDRVVYLDLNQNGTRDPGDPTTTTSADGKYSFANLTSGVYTVVLEGQQGMQPTSPSTGMFAVTLSPGQDASGFDFATTQSNGGQRPPRFTNTAPTNATAGQIYRYGATVSNLDGRPLIFDLPVSPAGMTVDAATGVFVWKPSVGQFGEQRALLRVKDDRGNVDIQNLTITVALPDNPPVITSTAPTSAVAGSPYSYLVLAQDADGDSSHLSTDHNLHRHGYRRDHRVAFLDTYAGSTRQPDREYCRQRWPRRRGDAIVQSHGPGHRGKPATDDYFEPPHNNRPGEQIPLPG